MDPLIIEIIANLLLTISVFLAARNSQLTWPLGIVGCAFFAVMCFNAKLYAEVTLQIFYIIVSCYGWYKWRYGVTEQQITKTSTSQLLMIAFLGVLVTVMYSSMLIMFTDALAPIPDTLVLTASVIAQFLLMYRRIETWYFWLLVNTVSIPLFAYRELYITSLVYVFYWANAFYGFMMWRKYYAQKI